MTQPTPITHKPVLRFWHRTKYMAPFVAVTVTGSPEFNGIILVVVHRPRSGQWIYFMQSFAPTEESGKVRVLLRSQLKDERYPKRAEHVDSFLAKPEVWEKFAADCIAAQDEAARGGAA